MMGRRTGPSVEGADKAMSEPIHLIAGEIHDPEPLSFEEFFEREKDGLYGALCLVTRNRHEAEELTQDAFVRILERWDRVSLLDDPKGYLYRTAMNAFRSGYRRTILAAKRSIGITRPDDAIAAVDARDVTVRALSTLSPRQRAAVVLVDLLGYPSEEAAKMLGIRASTVRMHTSRAHAALKGVMPDA
jgi:RNA polymerase sigma factor, sigma-70 family